MRYLEKPCSTEIGSCVFEIVLDISLPSSSLHEEMCQERWSSLYVVSIKLKSFSRPYSIVFVVSVAFTQPQNSEMMVIYR